MTPAARVAAAIEILDRVVAGEPAEKALTNWARHSRFAGSGDRAAIRDHVFDALRCRRSFASLGGAQTGRGLMLGALRAAGLEPEDIFTGQGHAPMPLSDDERLAGTPPGGLVALDIPDWIAPQLEADLGVDFAPVCAMLRHRAPVFLRVNRSRISRTEAAQRLAAEQIRTQPHILAKDALEVTENPRKIRNSDVFRSGLVELQDVASQALSDALPIPDGGRVLDYCAGGGGKSLAMAARVPAQYFAHDAAPARMADLAQRGQRAGALVRILGDKDLTAAGPFDLVLCDVPCSGSGAWRRAPEGKWSLTPDRLSQLGHLQGEILARAHRLVAPCGVLAYATCSLLSAENEAAVAAFLSQTPGWLCTSQRRFSPLEGGDGFFLALLKRA